MSLVQQQLPRAAASTEAPAVAPSSMEGGNDNAFVAAQMGPAPAMLGLFAPWFPGLLPGCGPSVVADALDDLAGESPVFAGKLAQARALGCTFSLGSSGAGTTSDVNAKPPSVTIDPLEAAQPDTLARMLTHELGHVLEGPINYVYQPSMSRDQYIVANTMIDLRGESAATIAELEVRDDLLAKGRDIGISGAAAADKIRYWEAYKLGAISEDALKDAIALVFAHKEEPSDAPTGTYWHKYGINHATAWEQNNPGSGLGLPPPPPLP